MRRVPLVKNGKLDETLEGVFLNPGQLNLEDYKKLEGILYAVKYFGTLPQQDSCALPKKVAIVSSSEQWEQIRNEFENKDKKLILRFDSKSGLTTGLPKPRNLKPDEIGSFIKEQIEDKQDEQGEDGQGKPVIDDWIVVIEEFEDEKSISRLHSQGAFNIYMKQGENIIIDYIGPGFKPGELNSGEVIHIEWEIPWDEAIFFEPEEGKDVYRYMEYLASEEPYKRSRDDMVKKWQEDKKLNFSSEEIRREVPESLHVPDEFLFKRLLDHVIHPLTDNDGSALEELGGTVVIEVMVTYNNQLMVNEIGLNERFKNMIKSARRKNHFAKKRRGELLEKRYR